MNRERRPSGMWPAVLAALASTGPGIACRPEAPEIPAAVVEPVPPALPSGPLMEIDPVEAARAGRERHDNALEMSFSWCPPGSFRMARPLGPRDGGVDVALSRGFWIGRFEVTQEEWREVMGVDLRAQRARDPSQPRPVGDGTTRDHVGEGPKWPIYFVSHGDATEFCDRLNERERAAGRLEAGWRYDLPTEAQWEFACRAGTTTATAFGDDLASDAANFDGSRAGGPYLRETTPVGRYAPNAWGLHDMHGNVWEWCRDGHRETPLGGPDPCAAADSGRYVYRGGCWHNPPSLCWSAARGWGETDTRGSGLGFRVALVADEEAGPGNAKGRGQAPPSRDDR